MGMVTMYRVLASTSWNDVTFTSVWQKVHVELHQEWCSSHGPVTTTNSTPS